LVQLVKPGKGGGGAGGGEGGGGQGGTGGEVGGHGGMLGLGDGGGCGGGGNGGRSGGKEGLGGGEGGAHDERVQFESLWYGHEGEDAKFWRISSLLHSLNAGVCWKIAAHRATKKVQVGGVEARMNEQCWAAAHPPC
jgi:hypothetical protein